VILLTGFPGFLGARLLPRLLEAYPGEEVSCLVQEKFLEIAEAARGALHGRDRVRLLRGDIAHAGLGLSEGDARSLEGTLAFAFHLAAVYDLAVSREVGERVNVLGTRNVLAFLQGAKGLKRLHYVSTAYVSGRATGTIRETDLELGQSFHNHYEATKHAAEVAVRKSSLPLTIYRPGIVVGDSRTGETGKFDGPYYALRAMDRVPSPGLFLRVGTGRREVNLVPLDFVIDAIACLAPRAESLGKTYHLTDPSPRSVLDVERLFARALGKRFLYVPVPSSLAKLAFAPRVVQAFFGMPREVLDYFDYDCHFDASLATADLAKAGVACPPFASYVDRLVAFYEGHRDTVRRGAMV
jgi:thioester reductase-like protein